MINRRKMIQGMTAAGALGFGLPSTSALAKGAAKKSNLKRVIFFLQNNGFQEDTCTPKDVTDNCKLSEFKLVEHMKPLEPYKDKMQVLSGLHGKHCTPGHSAFFGALGGYRGSLGSAPTGPTVDHLISQHLPKTILPHLCIGFESLSYMKALPSVATLSASGAGKPIYMHSNPKLLYQSIFGGTAGDEVKKQFETDSNILKKIEQYETKIAGKLPKSDKLRYSNYTDGIRGMNSVREQLVNMSDQLKKYAPKLDERYSNPEFETDWHHCLLEIGIAALQSGLTNVLTVGSGRGHFNGSYEGAGVLNRQGHALGHVNQAEEDFWVKIRQYNCQMMIKVMKALEAVPEGKGTMMDNTLIVYTSCAADHHHSMGGKWPFVLLGNGGGAFKTGVFTKCEGRPINDLYTTFLHAAGAPVDSFNIPAGMSQKLKSKVGPIEGMLA